MKTLEKRMKALDKRIMKFGKSLEGRLDARLIESALDYIHFQGFYLNQMLTAMIKMLELVLNTSSHKRMAQRISVDLQSNLYR